MLYTERCNFVWAKKSKVLPFLSLDDVVVDEDVEGDEDEDGSKLSGDEGVDTVEHRVIPEHTFQPRYSYNLGLF